MQHVCKGSRVLVNGRLEYRRTTKDEIMTTLAVVAVGESVRCICGYMYVIRITWKFSPFKVFEGFAISCIM